MLILSRLCSFSLILSSLNLVSACATLSDGDDSTSMGEHTDVLEYRNAPAGTYYDLEGNESNFYSGINLNSGPEDDFTIIQRKLAAQNKLAPLKSDEEIAQQELLKLRSEEKASSSASSPRPVLENDYRLDSDEYEDEEIQPVDAQDSNWNGLD